MSIEAMKQALEALEYYQRRNIQWEDTDEQAITSLRQAIADAERQDKFCDDNCVWTDHHPDCVIASVSWKDMAFARLGVVRDKMHQDDIETVQRFLDGDYTHPQPKRKWVGLITEERDQVQSESYGKVPHHVALISAVEAKLKEKNT